MMMAPRITVQPSPAPAVAWDETACPLCGQDRASCVAESQDPDPTTGTEALWFAVVECQNCSLRYTNPRPDPESIGSFYSQDYKPHRSPRKTGPAQRSSWWSRVSGRSVERRGEIPWDGEPGRLLDFGCGGGSFLRRMADRGWSVTGVDASASAVREVQESLGLTALNGTLPHPDLSPSSFEVITMWHSIEHVHDPIAVLREAFRLLVPGGKIIVACPNHESSPRRWFGSEWFGLDLPRHLIHFSPSTLRDALEVSGFCVESIRPIRHADWLRSSARLAIKRGTARLWQRPFAWKPIAKIGAALTFLFGQSDCMIAVAERPR